MVFDEGNEGSSTEGAIIDFDENVALVTCKIYCEEDREAPAWSSTSLAAPSSSKRQETIDIMALLISSFLGEDVSSGTAPWW